MTADTPDALALDAKFALACVDKPELLEPVKAALEGMGYRVHVPPDVAQATERLRRQAYEIIVIDEGYQGATAHDSPLMTAVHSMPMSVRRYSYVVLLGQRFVTFDNMLAYTKSVNLTVNTGDLPQFAAILKKGLAENDEFYKVFRDVLREAGKR